MVVKRLALQGGLVSALWSLNDKPDPQEFLHSRTGLPLADPTAAAYGVAIVRLLLGVLQRLNSLPASRTGIPVIDHQPVSVINSYPPTASPHGRNAEPSFLLPLRRAQKQWQKWPLEQRARLFRRLAAIVVHRSNELAGLLAGSAVLPETALTTEVIPLAAAAHDLSRHLPRLLRPGRRSISRSVWWNRAACMETRHEPWGIVLILGSREKPVFLTGVSMWQALAAGNGVLLKPGRQGERCAQTLRMLWVEAGGDAALIQILPDEPDNVERALEQGVDHVVLLGSSCSYPEVIEKAAETRTPLTVSLSSGETVVIYASGDLERAARMISSRLNQGRREESGLPHRIFVPRQQHADLLNALQRSAADWKAWPVAPEGMRLAQALVEEAISQGARLVIGEFPGETLTKGTPLVFSEVTTSMRLVQSELVLSCAVVMTYEEEEELGELLRHSPCGSCIHFYGEGAEAFAWARKLPTGCVVLNGMEAALTHPQVAAPCWDANGWGVTRGPQGLLQMTRLQVLLQPPGKAVSRPKPAQPRSLEWEKGRMKWSHGRGWQKWQGLTHLLRAIAKGRSSQSE